MCKELVAIEIYNNMRTAFNVLKHLRDETGMAWSMYSNFSDINGHAVFVIHGMFDTEDIDYARNAVTSIETSLGESN